MSAELNQYGSVALNYDSDSTESVASARSASPVAEVVAVAPKKTTLKLKTAPKPKTAPKKTQKKTEEPLTFQHQLQTDRWANAVAEEEVAVATIAPHLTASAAAFADDVEVCDMSEIERMIANAIAPLQQRLKAIEDAEDRQPLAKGGKLGYYQVKDGDEELCRTREMNATLRKEIEAKTKTNQKLQEQLLGDNGNEVVRLKAMNLALRKERDGARKGRNEAIEQMERYRQLLEDNGITYEAN